MDTKQNNADEILDFSSFIRLNFPLYQFTDKNQEVIKTLGLWATRNPKFNNKLTGWHIDRGILIYGSVGCGKDELIRLLRKYLSYLRSNYVYACKIVWKFSEEFNERGYSCFNEEKGNMYYAELARTNEMTNTIDRELVNYFGNKLLVGQFLIDVRYESFKDYGYQTHFSTNHSPADLEGIYGGRSMDRLREMCNFIRLEGSSWRGKVEPTFKQNVNNVSALGQRETTEEEHEENRQLLDEQYQQFLKDGSISKSLAPYHYNLLISYGCRLDTMNDLSEEIAELEKTYVADRKLATRSQADRNKERSAHIWREARTIAVYRFYGKLKEGGAQSIFKMVDVNMEKFIEENNKKD